MSFEELVNRLVEAARAAFGEVRERHPGESFYFFALFTDAFAAYILPSCGSEEGLRSVAEKYVAEFGQTVEQQMDDLRWSPVDSPHHMGGEEHFRPVLELLERRGDPWQRHDDGLDAEVDGRFEACFRALEILDEEGFFGRGPERDRVLVNVLQGDQSERSVLENARRLNPPAAVARLERDLDIPAPEGEFVTLGSRGAYQIRALEYAPGPGLLVACGSGGDLFAWDLHGGRELLAAEHSDNYWGCALSADGRTLLVNDTKRVMRVDLSDGARHDTGIRDAWAIAISPDGATVAATGGGSVRAIDVAEGHELWRAERPASALSFSGDGSLLALIGDAHARGVTVLDASDGTLRHEIQRKPSRGLAWAPDDGLLATADQDGHIRLWHSRDGFTPGPTFDPVPGDVTDLAFSPDGTLLATAHTGGDVNIWDIDSARHLERLHGTPETMNAVVFVGDRQVAAAGRDVDSGPPVHIWTVEFNAGPR
ncbi:hypothetical protein GCM10022254_14590 [Actinomadura meridiana]|uniref:Pyrrolo-quinoline quinone repeat domain-containing protein n=1 Tax=Actinomadura meridiana TaxID=559626 RepID=A0ABP8BV69_9ACTN